MEPWLRGLYDAEGMRAVDRWAIEDQGVDSLALMEAAGRAVAAEVAKLDPQGPVRVVCGKGNNGGDGLVAARLLGEMGFEVETLLLWPAAELTDDAAANLPRLGGADGQAADDGRDAHGSETTGALLGPGVLEVGADIAARLAGSAAVVDAIFGTGFSGAPREPAAGAIGAIGDCGAPVVACDVASGVDAATGEAAGAHVEGRRQPSPSTAPRSATTSPPASGRPASWSWRRSGFPGRGAGAPRRGRRDRTHGARPGAAPRARSRPSSPLAR